MAFTFFRPSTAENILAQTSWAANQPRSQQGESYHDAPEYSLLAKFQLTEELKIQEGENKEPCCKAKPIAFVFPDDGDKSSEPEWKNLVFRMLDDDDGETVLFYPYWTNSNSDWNGKDDVEHPEVDLLYPRLQPNCRVWATYDTQDGCWQIVGTVGPQFIWGKMKETLGAGASAKMVLYKMDDQGQWKGVPEDPEGTVGEDGLEGGKTVDVYNGPLVGQTGYVPAKAMVGACLDEQYMKWFVFASDCLTSGAV